MKKESLREKFNPCPSLLHTPDKLLHKVCGTVELSEHFGMQQTKSLFAEVQPNYLSTLFEAKTQSKHIQDSW